MVLADEFDGLFDTTSSAVDSASWYDAVDTLVTERYAIVVYYNRQERMRMASSKSGYIFGARKSFKVDTLWKKAMFEREKDKERP
jgi:hypothetical protein